MAIVLGVATVAEKGERDRLTHEGGGEHIREMNPYSNGLRKQEELNFEFRKFWQPWGLKPEVLMVSRLGSGRSWQHWDCSWIEGRVSSLWAYSVETVI